MKRRWDDLHYVMAVLRNRAKDKRNSAYLRNLNQRLYDRLKSHEVDVNEAISEAQMQGLRNPAFPDDLVGWLDDDFDYDEDEDDNDDKKK